MSTLLHEYDKPPLELNNDELSVTYKVHIFHKVTVIS